MTPFVNENCYLCFRSLNGRKIRLVKFILAAPFLQENAAVPKQPTTAAVRGLCHGHSTIC